MAFSQRGQNQVKTMDNRILSDLITVSTKTSDEGTIFEVFCIQFGIDMFTRHIGILKIGINRIIPGIR